MENKVQNLNWTGICDPWVHLSALPLSCWVTLGKLFHLPMCKSPTYKKEVMVYISLVLSTCVRNATEKKAHFKLNKWPSPFQFFMLQHLFFLSCTLGQLLKADEAFTNWFQSGSSSLACDQDLADLLQDLVLLDCSLLFTWLFKFLTIFPWSGPKQCC